MLRTALLLLLMLCFGSADISAATTSRPIHRHKPTAGNYVPVYRYYRGHSNQKRGFFGLFKHRSTAAKRATKRATKRQRRFVAPKVVRSSRAHRTM